MRKFLLSLLVAICTVLLSSGLALAKTDPEPSVPLANDLTLQAAVDRAMVMSNALKTQNKQVDIAKENLTQAQDAVTYTPIGYINDDIQMAYSSLLQRQLSYQTQKKNLDSLQEDIKAQVVQKYIGVQSAQEALEYARQAVKQTEWNKSMAQVTYNVGTSSLLDITQAQAAYESALNGVSRAEQALDTAYVDLNALTAYRAEDRHQLTTVVEYPPLEVNSLTSEINRVINNSSDVWGALQRITIEQQDLRMVKQPYEVEKLEINVAELTAAQAKEALETSFLQLYHGILAAEIGVKASEDVLPVLTETLRATQVRYNVGMAVQGELIKAETDLAKAENDLASARYALNSNMAVYMNLTGRDILPTLTTAEEAEAEIAEKK